MAEKNKKKEPLEIEAALQSIEEIIGKLEDPEVSLQESLKLYSAGVTLVSECRDAITGIEKEIELLEAGDESKEER